MTTMRQGWQIVTVGTVCELFSGSGFPIKYQGRKSGEVPFFKVGDISNAWKMGTFSLHDAEHYISRDEVRKIKARLMPENSVVFAKIGAAISLNRRAVLAQPSLIDNNCMALWASPQLVAYRYLFHYLCTLRLGESSRASIVPSLRRSDVADQMFPLPPLAEQHRIVAKIEELFSRLDAGVAALTRVRANLKRYRASVLNAAVTGKLTAEWRKKNPPKEPADKLLTRILDERRKKWEADQLRKFTEAGKASPKGWKEKCPLDRLNAERIIDANLPKGWCPSSIEQICSSDAYSLAIGPFGSNLKTSDYTSNGVPLVFVRNIRSHQYGGSFTKYVSPSKAIDLKAHTVDGGDILVTKMGEPPGDADMYPIDQPRGVITADCIKIRLHPILKSTLYFVYAISAQSMRSQIAAITKGVAQQKVSLGRFEKLVLPLPALEEQAEIVSVLEHRLSLVNAVEAEIDQSLRRASRLRQAILKRAFEGKLVPQDPNDHTIVKPIDLSPQSLLDISKTKKKRKTYS